MTRLINLGVGLPAYGATVSMWQARMWVTFGMAAAESIERFQLKQFTLIDACGIDVARNRLCAEASAANVEWLIMVDADTWVDDGRDLLQMVSDAAHVDATTPHRVGAVFAPVPRRDPDDANLMVYDADRRYVDVKQAVARADPALRGLIQVSAAATAICAINIARVKRLVKPWFQFLWERFDIKPTLSEDLYFCQRLQDDDLAVLVDPRVRTRHLRRPAYAQSETIGG